MQATQRWSKGESPEESNRVRETEAAEDCAFIQRYNRNRRHSTLDYLTREEADLRYRHELPLAA